MFERKRARARSEGLFIICKKFEQRKSEITKTAKRDSPGAASFFPKHELASQKRIEKQLL